MSYLSINSILTCANCGKGEENGTQLKTCTACKLVKYCNRECQIAHRPQHKEECKKRAAKLLCKGLDDMVISDDELFKQPPPKQDCPICMLPMPHAPGIFDIRTAYQPCCGKRLCNGCMLAANDEMDEGNIKRLCPFCRVPIHEGDNEFISRCKIRMVHDDAMAIQFLGSCYNNGGYGLPKDREKAMELFIRAAELGSAQAHNNIAFLYENGQGVEEDMIKAQYHYKLAAIGGHEEARDKLGHIEGLRGNNNQALKHFIIGASCGYDDSLDMVGAAYQGGGLSKDEYAKMLRTYQTSIDEMKSEQRSKAAAYDDKLSFLSPKQRSVLRMSRKFKMNQESLFAHLDPKST